MRVFSCVTCENAKFHALFLVMISVKNKQQ